MINGININLRTVVPGDAAYILEVENTPGARIDDENPVPYTREIIEDFIQNSHHDIYTEKQLRLIVEDAGATRQPVGIADLFDYSAKHKRVAVGIWINGNCRNKGYASEAIGLMVNYCFKVLGVHQIYCTIAEDNEISLRLFQKLGFVITATRRQWLAREGAWAGEYTLQRINE